MEEMDLAIKAATTPAVQIWMNWMLIVFAVSIIFSWKHKNARFVLAAFILSIPVGLFIFSLTKSAHLIGIAHILLWGPLAVYLILKDVRGGSFKPRTPYGIWIILLLSTIFISLFFDIRDAVMILSGMK